MAPDPDYYVDRLRVSDEAPPALPLWLEQWQAWHHTPSELDLRRSGLIASWALFVTAAAALAVVLVGVTGPIPGGSRRAIWFAFAGLVVGFLGSRGVDFDTRRGSTAYEWLRLRRSTRSWLLGSLRAGRRVPASWGSFVDDVAAWWATDLSWLLIWTGLVVAAAGQVVTAPTASPVLTVSLLLETVGAVQLVRAALQIRLGIRWVRLNR